MKTYIYTSLSFTIVGILLGVETARSDELEKDIPPLCRFKICGIGQVPVSNRDTKDIESENDSADIDSTIEKSFENEETETTENIIHNYSGVIQSKKFCLFKLCSTEPIAMKLREEDI